MTNEHKNESKKDNNRSFKLLFGAIMIFSLLLLIIVTIGFFLNNDVQDNMIWFNGASQSEEFIQIDEEVANVTVLYNSSDFWGTDKATAISDSWKNPNIEDSSLAYV